MPQFGVRLSDDLTDVNQVVAATGLSTDAVRRELADGFLARGLSRSSAERMVANLANAGLTAEVCTPGVDAGPPAGNSAERLGALGGGNLGGGNLGGGNLGGGNLGAGLGKGGLGKRGLGGLGSLPKSRLGAGGLPGLGLGRVAATTILGPPAPAEPETARADAIAPPADLPPADLPPPVAMTESVDLPPITLPAPLSDAELMPSLKVADPAALPPPKVLDVPSERPPAAPRRPTLDPPVDRRTQAAISAPPVTRPERAADPDPITQLPAPPPTQTLTPPPISHAPHVATPPRPMPLAGPSSARTAPPRSTRVPWIVAGTLVVLSGVFVAWAWSGRDAGMQAMRRAEVAFARGDYPRARAQAERARSRGADIWADRMVAAAAAGPHVDRAVALLNGDDLDAAEAALAPAQALAPKDPRTLQVTVDIMRQRAAIAPKARPDAVKSAAVKSAAPPSVAPATITSAAPASVASTAPATAAPATAAPATAAPAPVSVASAAPATAAAVASAAPATVAEPPAVRFARPPSRPTRDRSKVARLKIVSDLVGEIVVDGDRVSVAVPGWIEVPPGRRKIAIRGVDGEVRGLRAVKVQAGRRATVRLRAE